MIVIQYKENETRGEVVSDVDCVTFIKGRVHIWKADGTHFIKKSNRTVIIE